MYEVGKSKPVYFLTDLWDVSIKSGVCPEFTDVDGSIYRFRAYGKGSGGHYVGHIERLMFIKGQGLITTGHCLYAEFPSAVWDRPKSLHAVLLDIVADLGEGAFSPLQGDFKIRSGS